MSKTLTTLLLAAGLRVEGTGCGPLDVLRYVEGR